MKSKEILLWCPHMALITCSVRVHSKDSKCHHMIRIFTYCAQVCVFLSSLTKLGLIAKRKFTWCKHANFRRRDSRKLASTERNLVHSARYLVLIIIFFPPPFDPAAQTTTFLHSRKEHHCQEHKTIWKGLQPQARRLVSISRAKPLFQCRTQ
jgi:hypothetical protein